MGWARVQARQDRAGVGWGQLDRVPAWLWEVRREKEPPKKWYFNFGGLFLSQKKFYSKKLNGIGESHPVPSNSAIWKHFLKFHLASAPLWLPPPSLATCPPNLAKSLFSTVFPTELQTIFLQPDFQHISSRHPCICCNSHWILAKFWNCFAVQAHYHNTASNYAWNTIPFCLSATETLQ